VFERFTEPAREVVALAQDEARSLRHNYLGTEHLLLGLLRREAVASRALASLGVGHDDVHAQVARIVGSGDESAVGQIPFTPRSKKVLELSLREAVDLGHNHIGTEHLLLAILREGEGVAARILVELGADDEKVRHAVGEILGRSVPAGRKLAGPPRPVPRPGGRRASRLAGIVLPLCGAALLGLGILIGRLIWG
jgi:ATP-dependent Clp protease ATP-binding subunit ClpC